MENFQSSVNTYLKKPFIIELSEAEKNLAIAIFSALKELDHTWINQVESLKEVKYELGENEFHNIAISNLLSIPKVILHTLK